MEKWENMRSLGARSGRHVLPILCIGLLGIGAAFASRGPARPLLEALDPTFMQAVTATVSQHDVKAILAHQHSNAPVHLRLYTSCDDEQRCTIMTAMDFPDADAPASALSLRVAVHVSPGNGSAHDKVASSWQVQSSSRASHHNALYAGDFRDLTGIPAIGEAHAIANLLTSMQSAIREVLNANGMTAQPHSVAAVDQQRRLTNPVRQRRACEHATACALSTARFHF
ncbi:MAG: hypothetical protein WKG03_10485 [Telluria sp.]